MTVRTVDAYPTDEREVPAFLRELGLEGILDVHVHALPDRLQEAVWRFFDGLDDPPWPIHYRQDAEERLAVLRRVGVTRHTALAYAHRPGMLSWLNEYTLGLADQYDQVVPTFTIYPEEGVADATRQAIDRGGRVVKVHLQVGRFHATDVRLDDAWAQIADHRLPVVLHATAVYGVDGGHEYCGIDAVRALLDRHPDLVLVLAHLGWPESHGAMALAEECDSVYLDTAMTLHEGALAMDVDADGIARLHDLSHKILFGSDYPTIPHDYSTQLRALARLELDDAALRGVLHDHADALICTTR